jgi:uncharacterized CHY-type Zn-finger protein
MEPCYMCGDKLASHTQTEAQKRCKPKNQPILAAVCVEKLNHHTHTRNKKPNYYSAESLLPQRF